MSKENKSKPCLCSDSPLLLISKFYVKYWYKNPIYWLLLKAKLEWERFRAGLRSVWRRAGLDEELYVVSAFPQSSSNKNLKDNVWAIYLCLTSRLVDFLLDFSFSNGVKLTSQRRRRWDFLGLLYRYQHPHTSFRPQTAASVMIS